MWIFSFLTSKAVKILAPLLLFVLVSWALVNAREDLKVAQERLQVEQEETTRLNQVLDMMEKENEDNAKAIEGLIRSNTLREDELVELRNKLQRHDLKSLSEAKSGLIEKRVNDATQNYFSDLERITSE